MSARFGVLACALVAHARGALDGAALDAVFEGSNLPTLTPLPQQFVVLAGPVMTNFESKNNLGKPERDTRVSTAAQRHLARMVAAEGALRRSERSLHQIHGIL